MAGRFARSYGSAPLRRSSPPLAAQSATLGAGRWRPVRQPKRGAPSPSRKAVRWPLQAFMLGWCCHALCLLAFDVADMSSTWALSRQGSRALVREPLTDPPKPRHNPLVLTVTFTMSLTLFAFRAAVFSAFLLSGPLAASSSLLGRFRRRLTGFTYRAVNRVRYLRAVNRVRYLGFPLPTGVFAYSEAPILFEFRPAPQALRPKNPPICRQLRLLK